MVYKDTFMNEMFPWHYMVLAPSNLVCEYVPYWNMGAACYAFVAGATSKVPYSVILMGIGSCVLRLRAGATSKVPSLVCLFFGGTS